MTTKDDILIYLASMKAKFKDEFQVTKLGLFGSYAADRQQENSDIDILIEFEPETDQLTEKKDKIREIIKTKFQKEVDLCREKYIKPYFKSQIIKSVIYV
ncbi:MAG: nucleotidyltransferase domain-containing protein [Saprospiraceae bacterium]|nr:nucleotidyltransferase domain-containing protein [Saprospiraceae bacterium]